MIYQKLNSVTYVRILQFQVLVFGGHRMELLR